MQSILMALGTLSALFSMVPYISQLVRGVVKPRLVSWFIWSVLSTILTISSLAEGQIAGALLSSTSAIGCAVVLVLGWGRGSVRLAKLDLVCLVGALLGILSLVILKDPKIALMVSVSVNIIAFIPTLIHGWTRPSEESLPSFALASLGAALTLTSTIMTNPPLIGMIYPLYALTFNGLMALILLSGNYPILRSLKFGRISIRLRG